MAAKPEAGKGGSRKNMNQVEVIMLNGQKLLIKKKWGRILNEHF